MRMWLVVAMLAASGLCCCSKPQQTAEKPVAPAVPSLAEQQEARWRALGQEVASKQAAEQAVREQQAAVVRAQEAEAARVAGLRAAAARDREVRAAQDREAIAQAEREAWAENPPDGSSGGDPIPKGALAYR